MKPYKFLFASKLNGKEDFLKKEMQRKKSIYSKQFIVVKKYRLTL